MVSRMLEAANEMPSAHINKTAVIEAWDRVIKRTSSALNTGLGMGMQHGLIISPAEVPGKGLRPAGGGRREYTEGRSMGTLPTRSQPPSWREALRMSISIRLSCNVRREWLLALGFLQLREET